MNENKYILALILILLSTLLQAQTTVQPDEISINEGLSQGFISCMIQDSEGFLWIGTKNGLNRYDGEHFKIFTHNPSNPYSISGDYIQSLHEEGGFILVGTEKEGLNIYHKKSNRFYKVRPPENQLKQKTPWNVRNILKDALGQFWFYENGDGAIRMFKVPENFWETLVSDESVLQQIEFSKLPHEYITSMWLTEEKDQIILYQSVNQFWQIDVRTKKITELPLLDNRFKDVEICTPIGNNTIIISASNSGDRNDYVNIVQTIKDRKWEIQSEGPKEWLNYFSLWDDQWFVIEEHHKRDFYYFFEKSNIGSHQWSFSDATFKIPIKRTQRKAMLTDHSGVIWLGTSGQGLQKITPRKVRIKTYLEDFSIYAPPYATKDGEIILGGSGDPTVIYTPGKNPQFQKNGLYDYIKKWTIVRVWDGVNGVLWVASREYDELNNIYNKIHQIPAGGKLPQKEEFYLPSVTTAFARDDEKGLIYFAGSNMFSQYSPASKQLQTFDLESLGMASFDAFSLAKTANNHWWIGTSKGLIECIPNEIKGTNAPQDFSFKWHKANDKSQNGLLNNEVASLLTDPEDANILWLGTKGEGFIV